MVSPEHADPVERERDSFSLTRAEDYGVGRFSAMASPCEVLIDSDDAGECEAVVRIAADEARRVERKFSRYREDSIVQEINRARGRPIDVDEETASLIDYAATCWELSGGRFDITSGVLRRVWTFDGGERVPEPSALREVLRHVGWDRVTWRRPTLTIPEGMEIDLGGIGKEFAVDRAGALVASRTQRSFLANFGGDLVAHGERRGGRPWSVGVEDPEPSAERPLYLIEIASGALATSGNARRFVRWKGQRLGHILDPHTGWPIENAPRSVTVLAGTCLEAGTLSTLAYLQGAGAAEFLDRQGVRYWIL